MSTTIRSAISNFRLRRNAERLETEDPDDDGGGSGAEEEAALAGEIPESNSIIVEEEDDVEEQEGEFVGSATTEFTAMATQPALEESLLDDAENVDRDEGTIPAVVATTLSAGGGGNTATTIVAPVSQSSQSTTTPRTTTVRETTASTLRAGGVTVRDLQDERDSLQRRSAPCALVSSFFLLRLWSQALAKGDFGLLLICIVLTSWTVRFVAYARDREEELTGLINDWEDDDDNDNDNDDNEAGGGGSGEEEEEEEDTTTTPRRRQQRMSFQSQLALAIIQSQIHMMETGGYGHPDGGDETSSGVDDDAKSRWERFEYDDSSSTTAAVVASGSPPVKRNDCDDVGGYTKSTGAAYGEEEQCCSICLCEYEKGDKLVSLPCGHVFHDECITSWTDRNIRCPLCNLDLV